MKTDVIDWYIKNRPIYKRLSIKVESLLSEVFEANNISHHIITSRAKDIESLKQKISNDKYHNPKEQIQDFSGIRIITYVEDEVEKICKIIEDIFDIDKPNSINKSDDLGIDKVGYKSVHYVASLDKDRLRLPEYNQYIGKCFEIQVRTILQHAWAEIEHDKNYKFSGKLPDDLGRRFKILAGVLEMADREFNNISNEIDLISQNVLESTIKGDLNIPLSSTALTQYLATRFSSIIEKGHKIIQDTDAIIVEEMEDYGLNTLEDFEKLIPKDFESELLKVNGDTDDKNYTEFGIVRRVLIINDYDKYFTTALSNSFSVWSVNDDKGFEKAFFSHFGIDWSLIEKKYNVTID